MQTDAYIGSCKRRVFTALEDLPNATGAARVLGIMLLVLVAANALLVVDDDAIGTAEGLSPLFVFSICSTLIFAIEYALRVWTADMLRPQLPPARARIRYACSLMGLIDLLSWLPMLVLMFIPYSGTVMSVVRIIRLIRLMKVTRYMCGLQTISVVFRKRQREIVASFMILALLCIAASVLMFEAEHDVQPEQFDSVFTGLYWAMTTMTSTGYGDLVPITPAGRLIGFLVMVISIGVVAIPAGIFSAGFVAEFRSGDERAKNEAKDDAAKGDVADTCKSSMPADNGDDA